MENTKSPPEQTEKSTTTYSEEEKAAILAKLTDNDKFHFAVVSNLIQTLGLFGMISNLPDEIGDSYYEAIVAHAKSNMTEFAAEVLQKELDRAAAELEAARQFDPTKIGGSMEG